MSKYQNGWSPLIQETITSLFGGWLIDQYNDKNKIVFPIRENVFKAFKLTPYEKVRVVIVGSAPYADCQVKISIANNDPIIIPEANGLAFSVNKNMPIPKLLQNIFTAIETDLGITNVNPDLSSWAEQGVLLLNTVLTVEFQKPQSHAKQWQPFIRRVIFKLNEHPRRLIFLLWGSSAKRLQKQIHKRHITLTAAHPSSTLPHKHFTGCRHFSQVNNLLTSAGEAPINWSTDGGRG